MSPDQYRFVNDFAALLIPLGMPQGVARLYGYLLLAPAPVSLDQMAEDLEASKSTVSVAARLLENHKLARRHGERGSKRALYSATEDYSGLVVEKNAILGRLAMLLKLNASAIASGEVRSRMEAMSHFNLSMQKAMESAMKAFEADVDAGVPGSADDAGYRVADK